MKREIPEIPEGDQQNMDIEYGDEKETTVSDNSQVPIRDADSLPDCP